MSGSIHPTSDQLSVFGDFPDETPVRMLNLLRYRDIAEYPAGSDLDPGRQISGREAYDLYSAGALECVAAAGGSVFYFGSCMPTLIGPETEQWDDIALIEYPNRHAFESMISSPAYLRISGHRDAALEDSRLVPTMYQ